MPPIINCRCGMRLKAPPGYFGRASCPTCGHVVTFQPPPPDPLPLPPGPPAGGKTVAAPAGAGIIWGELVEEPMDVVEFFDPPPPAASPRPKANGPPFWTRIFQTVLDPRSIHWMLAIGGGLMVVGLVVWLVSLGLFDDPRIMAVLLSVGSVSILASGCALVLKTQYKTAGRALAMLGCVVIPLNLWFFHAQELITVSSHLWIGGLVCCGLYVATVLLLRDPLFLYAVEAGATLTSVLLLGSFGVWGDTTWLCVMLIGLAAVSIHAERMFAAGEEGFTRKRFGLPLFWCGHVQLAAALVVMFWTQMLGWLIEAAGASAPWIWQGNALTSWVGLAAGMWLLAAYLYFYSDIVVRRLGAYLFGAAICLLLAQVSLAVKLLSAEALIATCALSGLLIAAACYGLRERSELLRRMLPPSGVFFSGLPVLLGAGLHVRATVPWPGIIDLSYVTGWGFFTAMMLAAIGARISATLYRDVSKRWAAAHLFISAAALVVALAGLLRALNLTDWPVQAPVLMLLPIGYIIATRLWRGRWPERPLAWTAHVAAGVILLHVLGAALIDLEARLIVPLEQSPENLLLAAVFAEAALFYGLAGWFRRKSFNVYFALAAACGAAWQLLGYFGVPMAWYTMLYAGLGAALLVGARFAGLTIEGAYRAGGREIKVLRGRGVPLFQGGNAVLLIAFLAAILQGLAHLVSGTLDWLNVAAQSLTIAAGVAAAVLVPRGVWRWLHVGATIAIAALTVATLLVMIHLAPWQKLELFLVAGGLLLLVAGHVGRLFEDAERPSDLVTLGLVLGSPLVLLPLLAAVFYHRFFGAGPSLIDELGLLTGAVLMLLSGVIWQIRSTTISSSLGLGVYLVLLIVSLAFLPQVMIGVYLAIGGGLLFAAGLALSVYRERLINLPQRFVKREGLFRILNWR